MRRGVSLPTVSRCGAGVSPANWRVFEVRDGSNQATRQWVWGAQYIDEPLFMDVNDDPTANDDCDPDSGEDADRRYYYSQDRNWNVVTLYESDDGSGTAGRMPEYYTYTPYGSSSLPASLPCCLVASLPFCLAAYPTYRGYQTSFGTFLPACW